MSTRQVYTKSITQSLALNGTIVQATFITNLYQIYNTSTYNATSNKSQAHLVIKGIIDTSAIVTTNSFNAKVYNYGYPNQAPNWAVGNKTLGTTEITMLDQYCDITHDNNGARAVELRIGAFDVALEIGSSIVSKTVSFGNNKVWFSGYTRTPTISVISTAVDVGAQVNLVVSAPVGNIDVYAIENGTRTLIGNIVGSSGTIAYTCPTSLIASYTTQSYVPISFYGVNSIGTGNTTTKNFNIPSSYKPSVNSVTYTDVSAVKPAKYSQLIQGVSALSCVVNAVGNTGSAIVSASTNTGVNTYTGTTFLTQVLNQTAYAFQTKVIDSRSRESDVYTTNISVEEYAFPLISAITLYRCNSSGARQADGTYARCVLDYAITSLNNLNTKTLKVSIDGGTEQTITLNNYSETDFDLWNNGYQPSGLATTSGHVFTFALEDDFGEYTISENISVAIPHMDYVIDNQGNIGIGIGIMAESNKIKFNENLPMYFGNNEMDYVIEYGTSGNWNWQKWKSGLVTADEKHVDSSVSIDSSTNNTFYKSSIYILALPNIFISAPCVQMNCYCSAYNNNVITSVQTVSNSQITYCYKSTPTVTGVGIHIDTIIRGKWK